MPQGAAVRAPSFICFSFWWSLHLPLRWSAIIYCRRRWREREGEGEAAALGQHLYLVMVSSFKLIHSLASRLNMQKSALQLQKRKQKAFGQPPRPLAWPRGEKGVGNELQADNGDGGVALRGCLRSAVVARGSRRANDEWQGREGEERGLCHPRRLHANWLKCEFMWEILFALVMRTHKHTTLALTLTRALTLTLTLALRGSTKWFKFVCKLRATLTDICRVCIWMAIAAETRVVSGSFSTAFSAHFRLVFSWYFFSLRTAICQLAINLRTFNVLSHLCTLFSYSYAVFMNIFTALAIGGAAVAVALRSLRPVAINTQLTISKLIFHKFVCISSCAACVRIFNLTPLPARPN